MTTQKISSKSSALNKEEFLKLLSERMREQPKSKPFDHVAFSAELSRLSQLESLMDSRSIVQDQMLSNAILTHTMTNSALPGMLGKSAKAYTDRIKMLGGKVNELGFESPMRAVSGKLIITDADGNKVAEIILDSKNFQNLTHSYSWDGTNTRGEKVPEDYYYFNVELSIDNGSSVKATTFTKGKIDAVKFRSDGTKLVINGMEMPLYSVANISSDN